MSIILAVLVILLLLCASEVLWRRRNTHPEYMRKIVHITVGSFVAFWPFFLTQPQIVLLSAAFVVVVVASSKLNIFKAIHSVQRPTWGEIFFALAVGAMVYVTHNPWIYAAALLHMSLADGLAAVVGTKYGKKSQYHVFGHPKSGAGTLTFFVVSLTILAAYALLAPYSVASVGLMIIAVGATVLENVGIRGLDNLLVPLFVGVALNLLQ